jgi:translation initiation factor 2B subunit (eIF-2B alpha/beta/delta family)
LEKINSAYGNSSDKLFFWKAKWKLSRIPVFDVTPSKLITGLITKKGVILNPNREKLERLFFN